MGPADGAPAAGLRSSRRLRRRRWWCRRRLPSQDQREGQPPRPARPQALPLELTTDPAPAAARAASASDLGERLIFLVGAPRSGTTLLARILAAHSLVYGRAEPHLVTPLAHLGYYARVDKASYDPFNAEQAVRDFVADLPRGEEDYLDALRAYADTMYGRMLATRPGKVFFLDKTPAYALVLPFLAKLYPRAKYVVLVRNPVAVLTSYATSFFDGDYEVALAHNPVLARYVPALAGFLRTRPVPLHRVRYEEFVRDPERGFRELCQAIGLPFEAAAIEYGRSGEGFEGLGDPTGVARHDRPVTSSVARWAAEVASVPATDALVRRVIDELDPADLAELGYPRDSILAALDAAKGAPAPERRRIPVRYAIERKLLVALRRDIHSNALGRALKKLRFALDVVLRE